LRLRAESRLRFAGQITGCEGYVESASIGLLAGRFAAAERLGKDIIPPPPTTAHGALLAHITGGHIETIDAGPRSFQPMNVNFGLFPPLARTLAKHADKNAAEHADGSRLGSRLRGSAKTDVRKRALCARALHDLENWQFGRLPAAAE
jgi:methylenetetrahydrofolate--tRNA-(uracil-5-)-methyltransferase